MMRGPVTAAVERHAGGVGAVQFRQILHQLRCDRLLLRRVGQAAKLRNGLGCARSAPAWIVGCSAMSFGALIGRPAIGAIDLRFPAHPCRASTPGGRGGP